jgi:hypothetical protein
MAALDAELALIRASRNSSLDWYWRRPWYSYSSLYSPYYSYSYLYPWSSYSYLYPYSTYSLWRRWWI